MARFGSIIKSVAIVLAAAATVAAGAAPAAANGARRGWHHSHAVGTISRNVITPYYVGYYGGHYSYYKSAFIPPSLAPLEYSCSRWSYDGYPYWVC
jgi:hypothetical protein